MNYLPSISKYYVLLYAAILSILQMRCNKEEAIPAYVHIDTITFSTTYSSQGSSSHKILDAWVYIDDQLVGAFELPCTFPVLFPEGNHQIKILPGIKENGISETRIPYPFYERYEQTINLIPGEVTQVNPSTVYIQSASFTWMEDFEGAVPSICDSLNSDTVIQKIVTPADVFELTGSGGIFLSGADKKYLGTSCNTYTLPKAGAAVFLELNYKCNTDFNVGLRGYNSNNTIDIQTISLILRATNGWNKTYINLTKDIAGTSNSTKFAIFFSMVKNDIAATSYIYLDNVKLIN